jgi:hypothetical protein
MIMRSVISEGSVMDMMVVQDEFAQVVMADCPDGDWERIVADVEILEEESGYRINTASFAVVLEDGDKLTKVNFTLSQEARDAAIEVYREQLENSGDKIGSFGLEIDKGGKYRLKISYDAPERLNFILDGEKMERLNNYLATYQRTE